MASSKTASFSAFVSGMPSAWSSIVFPSEVSAAIVDAATSRGRRASGGSSRSAAIAPSSSFVDASHLSALEVREPLVLAAEALPSRRGLLLALLLAPFWINYLMRMLAWVNLLQTDGYVNDITSAFGLGRVNWLDGRAFTVIMGLAYGYVPYLVLPLFAALDRIDRRVLEASPATWEWGRPPPSSASPSRCPAKECSLPP